MAITIVSQPEQIVFTGNEVIVQLNTSLIGTVENLNIKCYVYLEFADGSNAGHLCYEKVDADTHFTFRFGALFESMVGDLVNVPGSDTALSADGIDIGELLPAYFELYFVELYENGTEGADETIGGYVMRGGIAFNKLDFTDWWTHWIAKLDVDNFNVPFLSWKSILGTHVDTIQPEVLNWFARDADTDLKFDIAIFDKDFLQIGSHTLTVNIPAYRVAQINVGYAALDIESHFDAEDGPCVLYTVTEWSGLSEIRRYYVDRKKYEHISYLLFENSLGVMETARLTGRCIIGGELQGDVVGKEYEVGQKVQAGLKVVTRRNVQGKVKKNTGAITKLDKAWMADLLLSKVVFELQLQPDGTWKKLPIGFTNKNVPDIDSQEFLTGFDLEWEYLWKDKYFTANRYIGYIES